MADSYATALDECLACESPAPLRFAGDSHKSSRARDPVTHVPRHFCYLSPRPLTTASNRALHYLLEREKRYRARTQSMHGDASLCWAAAHRSATTMKIGEPLSPPVARSECNL